jgi:hypothetical protein
MGRGEEKGSVKGERREGESGLGRGEGDEKWRGKDVKRARPETCDDVTKKMSYTFIQPDTSMTPLPMRYASMGYTSIGFPSMGYTG